MSSASRRLSYFWGPRIASAARKRWCVLRHPHVRHPLRGARLPRPGVLPSSPRGRHVPRRAVRRVPPRTSASSCTTATVRIGGGTVFTYEVLIQCSSTIEIGERCMFGQSTIIVDGNHRFRDLDRPMLEQGYDLRPIRIGDDASSRRKCTIIADVGERAFDRRELASSRRPSRLHRRRGRRRRKVIEYFGPPESRASVPPPLNAGQQLLARSRRSALAHTAAPSQRRAGRDDAASRAPRPRAGVPGRAPTAVAEVRLRRRGACRRTPARPRRPPPSARSTPRASAGGTCSALGAAVVAQVQARARRAAGRGRGPRRGTAGPRRSRRRRSRSAFLTLTFVV